MSKEQYENLKFKLDEIVNVAAQYDPHLQPSVIDCLSAALIAESGGLSSQQRPDLPAMEVTKDEGVGESLDLAEWDFRNEMLKMNESYDLSRKQFKDTEYAALLAFVVKRRAPNEQKVQPITKENLEEACRTVGRTIPSQPAYTLSTAKSQGLLEKVKGQTGYKLAPKGENRVNAILAAQDKS